MRFGLIFSILLHAIVLGFLIITIQRLPILTQTQDIPVEVTTVAEVANVKAASKEAQPKEEKPAPAPTPAPPPPQNPPEAAPPMPQAAPAETKPKPQETAEKEKPKPQPEVKPQSKPAPPNPEKKKDEKFDLDSIAALINKEQKAQDKQVKSAAANPGDKSEKPREQVGAGTDMTITLIQLLQRQIAQCWSFPAGAVQPESLVVGITIYLRRDGTLAEPPKLDDPGRMSEPYYRAAAEAAMRAINQCQPYDLPADQYEGENGWKEVDWTFDPSKMIGIPRQ